MNSALIHLAINHVSLFAVLFGIAVLFCGVLIRNDVVKRVACVFFVLAGLAIVPTYFSGEASEDLVKKTVQAQKSASIDDLIEEHEEIAEKALVSTAVLGVIAFATLLIVYRRAEIPKILQGVLLVAALVTLVFLGMSAYEGGKIRHPEAHSVESF